ncbi:SEC14-like protein 2 [Orchesella cincta]|uniref:SEC14-like protein 2 n=1 Tax=Orchesella cincta TaxID=48709 RepID=A0A1D2MYQ1_ORCCI|nr:SEC14-like protein 2 [Orchesella cincta]
MQLLKNLFNIPYFKSPEVQAMKVETSFGKISSLLLAVVVCFLLVEPTFGIPVEEDLTITYKEKVALEKFRQLVLEHLKDDYMKQDIYLIRWLRAANLDLKLAEQKLLDNLKWREENDIDNLLSEDFSDFERDYPYTTDTYDKTGRPMIAFTFGDWDLRKAVLAGQARRFTRYLDRAFENVTTQIRAKQARGENVTQSQFLINLENFNLAQQGCIQCLPAIFTYFQHQVYYPNLADNIVLVNTPTVFEVVLRILRPIMAPETRVALKVFGTNRQQWQQFLYSIIDKDQLSRDFGGTRSSYR